MAGEAVDPVRGGTFAAIPSVPSVCSIQVAASTGGPVCTQELPPRTPHPQLISSALQGVAETWYPANIPESGPDFYPPQEASRTVSRFLDWVKAGHFVCRHVRGRSLLKRFVCPHPEEMNEWGHGVSQSQSNYYFCWFQTHLKTGGKHFKM